MQFPGVRRYREIAARESVIHLYYLSKDGFKTSNKSKNALKDTEIKPNDDFLFFFRRVLFRPPDRKPKDDFYTDAIFSRSPFSQLFLQPFLLSHLCPSAAISRESQPNRLNSAPKRRSLSAQAPTVPTNLLKRELQKCGSLHKGLQRPSFQLSIIANSQSLTINKYYISLGYLKLEDSTRQFNAAIITLP